MKVSPPTRPAKLRPIALLTPGYRNLRIETEYDDVTIAGAAPIHEALGALEGHACYSTGALSAFRHTTGATYWQGSLWRERTVAMMMDGTKIKIMGLRGTLDESTDAFGDLFTAVNWLGERGVRAGSISSMAWALWRSTLTGDLTISAGKALGRAALYGGRQSVREPRTYQHMVAADITAAYPHSMAQRPYALNLRRVSASTVLDPQRSGLIVGAIGIPSDLPYGPVPLRVAADMICFPSGQIEGTWTWAEAAAAEALGCTVAVDQCWAPGREADLFGAWFELVKAGRQVGGPAAQLLKAIFNSLWGVFAMRGDERESIRWSDHGGLQPVRVPLADRALPHAYTTHIAAETASRVRVRVLREGCYGDSAASPVHIDTDGIIIRRSASVAFRGGPTEPAHPNRAPRPTSSVPGQWRIKTPMRKVEIRAPQVYRYQCGQGCGVSHRPWHYSVSGVPAEAAEAIFERIGHRGVSIAFNGTDIVLGSAAGTMSANDLRSMQHSIAEARGLREMVNQ